MIIHVSRKVVRRAGGRRALRHAPHGDRGPGTALAYLEHACRFKAPVRPGDTLASEWTVVAKLDKPRHKGGIAVLRCACTNQKGELVLEADGKILVASRPGH